MKLYHRKRKVKIVFEVDDMKLFKNLTERETEIVDLLPKGYTNKEIANNLGIAEHTVETHLDRIFRKLRVKSRTEAACTYILDQRSRE
jgi:DNA-binding NarL/FixJ family response regulator